MMMRSLFVLALLLAACSSSAPDGQCHDADRDGAEDVACGGTDCDDNDDHRFPGNTEVCDTSGHDEDCDPTTVGFRDADGDGYNDAACCNGTTCGDDCDDLRGGVHPAQPEVCNYIDDNCDTAIDDGVTVALYMDADLDGYGAGVPTMGCFESSGMSVLGNDCDDTNAALTPGSLVCRPQDGAANYSICTNEGTFEDSKCPAPETCHPQPTGLGVCF